LLCNLVAFSSSKAQPSGAVQENPKIPQQGESLNVAMAGTIALYELAARRQPSPRPT
jgi:tRNA(Leu) C34 or U34 (ribose-2'-O)-methylase TrmL